MTRSHEIVQYDTKVLDIPVESNSDISAGSLSVCSDVAVSKVKACANKLVYDKICDLRSVCLTFEKPLSRLLQETCVSIFYR